MFTRKSELELFYPETPYIHFSFENELIIVCTVLVPRTSKKITDFRNDWIFTDGLVINIGTSATFGWNVAERESSWTHNSKFTIFVFSHAHSIPVFDIRSSKRWCIIFFEEQESWSRTPLNHPELSVWHALKSGALRVALSQSRTAHLHEKMKQILLLEKYIWWHFCEQIKINQ